MGGRKEHPRCIRALSQTLLKSEPGDGSVGIEQVSMFAVCPTYRGNDGRVVECGSHQVLTHTVEVVVVQSSDAFEIARRAHVHGIRNCAD